MKNHLLPSSFSNYRGSEIDFMRIQAEIQGNRAKNNVGYQRTPKHYRENRKKEQMMEGNFYIDKFTEIERENRILLEKIHKIMNTNSLNVKPKPFKSLNYSQRVRRQRQISIDNFKLLKRLQSKKSFYDFNTEFFNPQSKIPKISQNQPSETFKTLKLSPILFDVQQQVYNKTVFIENKTFKIEITKGSQKVRIQALDTEAQEHFNLELSRNEALTLMGGSEDWEKLISLLHIDGSDLAIWQDDITSLNLSI